MKNRFKVNKRIITRRSLLLGAGASVITSPALAISGSRLLLFGGARPSARTTPLKMATFGDSLADFYSLTPTNSSAWNSAFGAGTTQITKSTKVFVSALYPQAFFVGNGGIGGQNTTSMLARSNLAPSTTRKAIEDIIALSPSVVLFRSDSINDLTGFTPPITQANINAVVARDISIISAFTNAGIIVITSGIYGYSGATNTAQVQAALVNLNAQLSAYSNRKYRFINTNNITCDTNGVYLANISSDGTHLAMEGCRVVANLEAQTIASIFGTSVGQRYPGTTIIPNANLSSTGLQAFGTLGTSWAINAGSSTRANAKIETINGVKYQTCEFTPTADLSNGQILVPFGIIGATPAIVLTAGQVYGVEADFLVQAIGGGAPPPGTLTVRIDISKGTPRNIYGPVEFWTAATITAPVSAHPVFEPITIPDFGGNPANLTAASFSLLYALSGAGNQTPFKIGFGNPNMVLQ